MANLPAGTVTFVFTDIEGSTRLLQQLGDRYASLLSDHHRLLRGVFQTRSGQELETHGDGLFYAFPTARAAVEASLDAQRLLHAHPWPEGASVRVRIGVHTGEPISGETGYVGIGLHRAARICAVGHGGQTLLSQTTRDLLEDDPLDGIGLRDLGQHRLKDLRQPQHLFQVVAADLPQDFPPLRSLEVTPNNLPHLLTSFVGRTRELDEVKQRLLTTRLLTLTGPGGCGKTRLALQAAVEVLDEFPDGTWLVELAPVSDPDLIPSIVATTLSIREDPERPIQATLVDSLRPKRLLLLLDSCEHLLTACARFADTLLRSCPHARLVATSQVALGIGGETVWLVPSLSIAGMSEPASVEQVLQSEAGSLFVERAQAAQRSFTVTAGNAHAVAQVCRRLDGIPLAIELAAARVKALAVEQIARRLDQSIALLAGGSRTAPLRHQTLQAALEWSYSLLSQPERVMLRRLSVFSGGFTLEAAEAVCRDAGEFDTLDRVTQLVDKSLLQVEPWGAEVRYRMLESVRLYTAPKLQEAGEETEVRGRHLAWCLELAEQQAQVDQIQPRDAVFDMLTSEHDNIRAAMDWAQRGGDPEKGLRLACAMSSFWLWRGHLSEGRSRLSSILESSGSRSPFWSATARDRLGWLAWQQGENAAATRILEEALASFRVLGARFEIAGSLSSLGLVARIQGEYLRARALFEEGDAIFRELNAKSALVTTRMNLGMILQAQGDYEAAKAYLQESLGISRESGGVLSDLDPLGLLANFYLSTGNYMAARPLIEQCLDQSRRFNLPSALAGALRGLASIARSDGDLPKARSLFEEAVRLNREAGHKRHVPSGLLGLASVALLQNNLEDARSTLDLSLNELLATGQKPGIALCLWRFAQLACQSGLHERAASLLGAAEALREGMGIVVAPADRAEYERDVSTVRMGLGEEAFAKAWAEGRTMTLDDAVRYALQDDGR